MSYTPIVLATGFAPFMGLGKNPSWEGVAALPDELLSCRIIKKQLPVKWFECSDLLYGYMEECRPRAVISFGQGYPKPFFQIERLGVNAAFGTGGDMDFSGPLMEYDPIFPNAPAAYFSTFPYDAIHERLVKEGFAAKHSFSAGQNQCNYVLYSGLHYAATRFAGTTMGFVHVPMIPDDGMAKDSLPLEDTVRGIRLCVEEVCKSLFKPYKTLEELRSRL